MWLAKVRGWFSDLFNPPENQIKEMDKEDHEAGREAPQQTDTVKPVKAFLSAEALIDKFKVREAGRDDGARNYPGPKADGFGDFEVRIAGQCNDALSIVRMETMSQLQALENKVQRYDIVSIETPLRIEHDETVRDLRSLASSEAENLTALKTAEYLALRAFLHFQRTHEQVTMPKERMPGVVVLCGILGAVSFEAILNSIFFAEAVAGGEVGGSVIAAVAAGANILISLWAGTNFIKLINHKRTGEKVFGWISILIFAGFLMIFHYTLAAMRNALVTIADQRLALSRLQEITEQNLMNPWSVLSDANSFLLMLLGLALGVSAATAGLSTVSDPYPGYSDVGDKYSKAKSAFSEAWSALRKKITDKVKALEASYKEKIKTQESRLSVFFRLTRDYDTAIAFYDENRKQIEVACARVLTAYWEENRAVRTARPPEHFGKEANLLVEFPHETTDAAPLREGYATIVDEDKARAEELLNQVHQEAERIVASLDELLDELENTANHRSLTVAVDVYPGSNVEQLYPYATNPKNRKGP